ncbi:DUF7519 family protein [Salinibaculum rarum]|uniref:DUF7519 family protein n=1 Tax=Salinibaculum rarum TaxID=3058903 RepID=UPI00265EC545|nr:hypothetical protein [Salinibaculum sp. KK48]
MATDTDTTPGNTTYPTEIARPEDISNLQPARISTATTILVTLVVAALVAYLTTAYTAVGVITVSSAAFAWAVHAINHDRLAYQLIGNLTVPALGILFILGLLFGAVSAPATAPLLTTIAFLALGGAIFGSTATIWGDIGDRQIYRALGVLPATILPATIVVGVVAWEKLNPDMQTTVGAVIADTVNRILTDALTPSATAADTVFSFTVVTFLMVILVRRAVATLPVVEFAPRDQTHAVDSAVTRMRRALLLVAGILLFLGVVTGGISTSEHTLTAYFPDVLTGFLHVLAKSTTIRALEVGVIGACLALMVGFWLAQKLTSMSVETVVRHAIPLLAGTLSTLGIVIVAATPIYDLLITKSPHTVSKLLNHFTGLIGVPVFVLFSVLFVVTIFIGVAAVPVVLAGTGFLPKRTAGPALAGGGIVTIGVVHGMLGGDALVVFTFLMFGAVAWDVGEYALTLGETIGRHASTTHTEAVHLVISLGSGVTAVGAAWITLSAANTFTVTLTPLIIFALAGLAAVFFAAVLQG